MRLAPSSPSRSPAAGALPDAPAAAPDRAVHPSAPSGLMVWAALWTVYIVWGSTYLALRVLVETVPPLVGTGSRFLLAGSLMLGILAVRRRAVRIAREEALGCVIVGALMMGAVATVATAEQDVPSNLAALLVACVPLWVLLLRRLGGEHIAPRLVLGVIIGFAGVGCCCSRAARRAARRALAAAGRLLDAGVGDRELPVPARPPAVGPVVSVGWQMLLGGAAGRSPACSRASPGASTSGASRPSRDRVAYLALIGSGLAFTAYTWLLENAPISRVSTYAYVNPWSRSRSAG